MPTSTRDQLLSAAQAFCNSFANKEAPEKIFSHFSSARDVHVVEHGLHQLASFLNDFFGQEGLREYFNILSSTLSYENMKFSNFIVDAEVSKVSVCGEAKFTWTSTGNSWKEVFTYALEFDEELKVKVYEVWADTGAAYLASKGELDA